MNLLRKLITVLVVIATMGVGVLFALQNTVLVPLDVLVYNFEPRSLALWVLAAFGVFWQVYRPASKPIFTRSRNSLPGLK